MPSLPSDISIQIVLHAKELPSEAWQVLENHARAANVVLPQALKAKEIPDLNHASPNIWFICRTNSTIEYILSVTDGPIDPYPIFIFTPISFERLVDEHIRPCIQRLVVELAAHVPSSRVYSIFSVEPVTLVFADEWTRHTGIGFADDHVYYAAKISYCTTHTLKKRFPPVQEAPEYFLRPAIREDIRGIGELCHLFASDSKPFILTEARAQVEAAFLIEKKQVWVHEAKGPGGGKEIASIVAFTRNSDRVVAITKVCTSVKWQRQGCAERLVRKVCEHFLTGPNCKESVVLYAAHNNERAKMVYDRVGFVGLAGDGPKVQDVDPWLEIGFDRTKVTLGHW